MSDFEQSAGDLPPSTGHTKRDLRRIVLSARRSQPVDVREMWDRIIRTACRGYLSGGVVAAYAPMPGEPGGAELPAALAERCDVLLLPVTLPSRDLDWARWDGSTRPGALGIVEPAGPRLGVTAITSASVVFVPGLAVDPHGRRLGRGGGSYDRALARVDPAAVTLVPLYPGEYVDAVPVEPHDRPVRGVVIDGEVRMCEL